MYGIFLAQVVSSTVLNDISSGEDASNSSTTGSRLGVRILPHMASIDAAYCPLWPPFFKNEIIAASRGDYVWVICNEDFSLGFILGIANNSVSSTVGASPEITSYKDYSPSTDAIKTIGDTMEKILGEGLNLNNILVDYWDANCLHFIKRQDGSRYIVYRNGTFYIMKSDRFIVSVGSGSSSITVSSDGISLVSDKKIDIQAPSVGLGDNAVYSAIGSRGNSTVTAVTSVRI